MNQPLPLRPKAPDEHHARLLDGLAAVLMDKSFHDTTVADIVQAARVSKRTFYEQFASKEDCLLALCERTGEQALGFIAAHYDPQQDWVQQLRTVTHGYLSQLQTTPALVRTLFIELLAIGPRGLAVRRGINQRFADFICAQVEVDRARGVKKRPLAPATALAVVGGINELILQAVEEGRADRLADLTDAACELVHAVVSYLMLPEGGAETAAGLPGCSGGAPG